MGVLSVDGRNSSPVESVEELASRFNGELFSKLPQWKKRLADDPASLQRLELEVHDAFRGGADLVVAGLIAVVMKLIEFEQACEQSRLDYDIPLTRGRMRSRGIRLLGGLLVWIKSMYCAPDATRKRPTPSDNVPGLYTELAQFGFAKGCSPGLEELVARRVAGCHSFDFALEELRRSGLDMSYKAVRRMAYECGDGLLTLRKRELEQWRVGQLLSSNEMAGKRVVIQIDGGRLKTRETMSTKDFPGILRSDAPSSKHDAEALAKNAALKDDGGRVKEAHRRRFRRSFESEWREPKLVTIFVIDDNGKQEARSQAWIEGTLEGPDALAEIIAMRLTQLGVSQAKSLTFVSDGAPWIWDRLDKLIERAGLPKTLTVHRVLDCCHAVHHVYSAVKALGYSAADTQGLYRAYRKQVREGEWQSVVEDSVSEVPRLT
jgi:hypothetical protein